MSIDYAAVTKAYRSGKSNVTRAKNRGDHAKVIEVCTATLDRFEDVGFPDDWAFFQRAADDATSAIRYGR